MAYSSARVLEAMPEPSSTSSRAPSVSSGARRFRISRSERAG